MECDQARELISRQLDDELEEQQAAVLREHTERCEAMTGWDE